MNLNNGHILRCYKENAYHVLSRFPTNDTFVANKLHDLVTFTFWTIKLCPASYVKWPTSPPTLHLTFSWCLQSDSTGHDCLVIYTFTFMFKITNHHLPIHNKTFYAAVTMRLSRLHTFHFCNTTIPSWSWNGPDTSSKKIKNVICIPTGWTITSLTLMVTRHAAKSHGRPHDFFQGWANS